MLSTITIASKKIGDFKSIKRVVGRRGPSVRNLTADEIKRCQGVVVERDTECNWFSRSGGCGWDTLLVVVE